MGARQVQSRRERLAEFDLSPGDFDVLATVRRIDGDDGVNPGAVLDAVLISSGGLTKRLDRLQTRGLLERHPDPDDRRGTLLQLTRFGRALADRAVASLLTAEEDELRETLGVRRMDRLADLLRTVLLAAQP